MSTQVKFVKLTGSFYNCVTNRTNANSYAVINSEGKFGYLPNENKIYTPVGGRIALKLVLDILQWK